MTKVIECIDLHSNDLILRNHIIDAIRQGLLYYTHTIPEYGKYRMDRFTDEIMLNYDDIDLDNKNYVIKEEFTLPQKKHFLKRIIRRK